MNKIVIAALLALAAGCSKKAPDCDAEIGKGMDSYTALLKQKTSNPDALLIASKLREATIERCKADKWTVDVVTCYGAIKTPQDIQRCQDKLTEDQRNKLMNELREEMMGLAGRRMPRCRLSLRDRLPMTRWPPDLLLARLGRRWTSSQ